MLVSGEDRVMVGSIAVLDVGGTSIKVGAVPVPSQQRTNATGGVDVVIDDAIPTLAASDTATVLHQLGRAAETALGSAQSIGRPRGMAIAFPGPFDLDAGRPLIRGLHKFESIYGMDVRAELRQRVDLSELPIVFVRDSEAVGVGEAVHGAGRDGRRVLTVAIGTGFGSCLTDGGVVVERVGDQEVDRLHELVLPAGRVDDVLSARGLAAVTDTATSSDPFETFGRRLGRFLDDITRRLDADLVVVGGGVAGSFDRFAPAARHEMFVPCVAASLGSAGPLLGAARLAFP